MRMHGMVYFLFNAHQKANYCVPEGYSSATLFTRPFLPFSVGGAGHETKYYSGKVYKKGHPAAASWVGLTLAPLSFFGAGTADTA